MYDTVIGRGEKWSGRIGRGKLLRFTALEAGANVSLMLFHADDLTERYNMPDTLKAQYTAHLTAGHTLMSDNGRVLASIVHDELGWHDPIGGYTTRALTDERYGRTTYQDLRNDWLRSGQENFAVELTRHGLGLRDMMPVVNLFSKVYCDDDGAMRHVPEHCPAGASVTLRTEMDVILLLSNTPNPLDRRAAYPSVPVRLEVTQAEPVGEDDVCLNHRDENRRAFENTWTYYSLI
ncbi:hypothetical protein COHCIP112018_03913 [Cohnella sp. JJ-181]|nr:hypothetical protein COHCIP112018_03913 [Cohnella sp. JJ-181]